MDDELALRPTLAAWLAEYDEIENDYIQRLCALGIEFAKPHTCDAQVARLRAELASGGARVRNAGASICSGALSSACVACTGDCGSKTFFLSLACNRSCYFCFNSNQAGSERLRRMNEHWRAEVDAYFDSIGGPENATHIGLTGGEPLLHAQQAVEFVAYVHHRAPQAHIRLYTAGDFLTEEALERLRDAGLSELRLSVKLDVADTPEESRATIDDAVRKMALVKRFIPQAMVEMPIIPGTKEAMELLLCELDAVGAWGINLLEFGYPFNDWGEFSRRGFKAKNPPYPVLYNWNYAGGLPIDESEALALELVQFAMRKGLGLGVHYCSLENKNRDQVITQNRAFHPNEALYAQDEGDFFFKTLKVFDIDIEIAYRALALAGEEGLCEREGECLLIHPSCFERVRSLPVCVALSYNVVEQRDDGIVLREVKLERVMNDLAHDKAQWAVKASAWELAALSLKYPIETLVDAVASGEWADAAREITASLGVDLSPSFDAESSLARESLEQEGGLERLKTEATRLFIGAPHAACSPYEGVRRSLCTGAQPLLFVNRYAMEVERFCKSCGLSRPQGTNEPLDHVATECELLEHLAFSVASGAEVTDDAWELPGGSAEAAYGQFVDEHAGVWFKEFADSLATTAEHPFYRAVAMYLAAIS